MVTTSERARTWLTAQLTVVEGDGNNNKWGVQILADDPPLSPTPMDAAVWWERSVVVGCGENRALWWEGKIQGNIEVT